MTPVRDRALFLFRLVVGSASLALRAWRRRAAERYEPGIHYMRGPGPKARSARTGTPSGAGRDGRSRRSGANALEARDT